MEYKDVLKTYTLPTSGKVITMNEMIDLKTLNSDEFLDICTKSNCSDNVWRSQFLKKFGDDMAVYKPINLSYSQYYLWLNSWLYYPEMDNKDKNNNILVEIDRLNREDLFLLWFKF